MPGKSPEPCGFFNAQLLHIAKYEDFTIFFPERRQCLSQLLPDLFPLQDFGRNLAPIGKIARHVVTFLVPAVGNGLHEFGMFFSSPHPRLVDRNLNQPGAESRFGPKLANMSKRL